MLDVADQAARLVAGMAAEPWGQVSPSVYETARLVTSAPWLAGHDRRLSYLLEVQRPDGAWGAPPAGYALVPTLSATEALLSALARADGRAPRAATTAGERPPPRAELVAAAGRGLRALAAMLTGDGALTRAALPDLPAIELIAPHLIELVNRHLDRPPPGLEEWSRAERMHPPDGLDVTRLAVIRSRLAAGVEVPRKLLHALEAAGPAAAGNRMIHPEATGAVGAAPAATAAWLGDRVPGPGDPARGYLERAVRRHAGPVPTTLPVTVFERAWVLSWLVRAGVAVAVPGEMADGLQAALGPGGTPAAAGLPADADTTAGVVYALSLLGRAPDPGVLLAFETDSHFCTWQGEDGHSVSTNAHVLEAFGHHLEPLGPGGAGTYGADVPDAGTMARYQPIVGKLSSWLRDQQEDDGSWRDRWHASPYYATACCATALDRFGGADASPAVRRARRWVLETQRADGSWGVWRGTAEETSYALQVLALTRPGEGEPVAAVVARGREQLLRSCRRDPDGLALWDDGPAMWHDKDLYLPTAIVRSGILAALHLTGAYPAGQDGFQ